MRRELTLKVTLQDSLLGRPAAALVLAALLLTACGGGDTSGSGGSTPSGGTGGTGGTGGSTPSGGGGAGGDTLPTTGQLLDRLRFIDAAESGPLLGAADAYTERMSPFDVQARLGDPAKTDPADYLAFASAQAVDWGDKDGADYLEAAQILEQRLDALGLVLPAAPAEILVAHTTGAEEGNAGGYTRDGTIVLPLGGPGAPDERAGLFAHELFHVLTRNNPSLSEDAHAIIGYAPIPEIALPAERDALRITNPDAPYMDRQIHVTVSGTDTPLVPILLSDAPYTGGGLFGYLHPFLYEPATDTTYEYSEVGNFYQQVGTSTAYIIHPEEISAEHFRLGLFGADPKDPALIQGLLDLFH